MSGNDSTYYLIIIAAAILLFIPGLGSAPLFDWDEINFAESSREMLVTGDYLTVRIDYKPFHEKPPYFMWLQAASMKAFGVNEFAARLPNALIGIVTLVLIFAIGKEFRDRKFGLFWCLTYVGSFLPHFYFRTGIIDPVFNLFIFLGAYFLILYFSKNPETIELKYKNSAVILAGSFAGMAVLTKGPVGWLLIALSFLAYWYFRRKELKFPLKEFLIFSIIAAVPMVIWYIFVYIKFPQENILVQFIEYQIRLLTTEDASHGGPFYYHFIILLFGCFPASFLALQELSAKRTNNLYQKNLKLWLLILLIVVLVVFSIVKTKIVHYSSLAYFPITFFAAEAIYRILFENKKLNKIILWSMLIIGMLLAAAIFLFPYVLMNIEQYLPKIERQFTRQILQTNVSWSWLDLLPGALYFLAVIAAAFFLLSKEFKKGFITMFGSTALVIFALLFVLAPKISQYTQGAMVEFYKSKQNCNCYVTPLGFKSYAQYFYTRRPPETSLHRLNIPSDDVEKWLLEGNIDKPAYFVVKNTKKDRYLDKYRLKFLYAKNGYAFLKRE